jgi:acyl carrier protein
MAVTDSSTLADRLAGLRPEERERGVVAAVRELTATVLGHGADDIEDDRTFKVLGFDSLTAVELRNRLSAVTGIRLPATIVFDHPSPTVLGRYVHTLLFPDAEPAAGLLDGLARVESALSALSVDGMPADAGLDKITGQMRRLLARWDELRGAASAAGAGIGSASDDELFALLDRRLGNSDE